MSELDIEHYRHRLLAEREQLSETKATQHEEAATVELDQSRTGRLSRMDALLGQAMAQEQERRADQELRRIATALARCDSGDYGFCVECGEPIAPARLEADPAAELCIRCAEAREH